MGKAVKIKASEVVVSPRGRKAEYDTDLLDDLTDLGAGEALDLSPYFGKCETQADRQRVGGIIRKHWGAVRPDECRIDFGNGVPQVRMKG